jgi:SAM-dependent methyltransferase
MIPNEKPQYFGKDLEAMSFAKNYHGWILKEFQPFLGDVVAEVGAGTGNFSQILLCSHIKQLMAFEPSGNMYPVLLERLKNNPKAQAINDYFGGPTSAHEEKFDSVIYVNVLEHVEDDTGELRHAFKAIKPGGRLLLLVPALPWLYSDLDRHLGHFRRYYKGELVKKVSQAGFRIVKAKYFDSLGIIPWYIFFTLLKRRISGNKVSLYDKIAVPIMSLLEGIVPPPIGKNVLLIGEKTGLVDQ